jgi:hypothetical protein
MADTLTLRAKNRAMLARQMLLAREAIRPALAVDRVLGLQAQWPKLPFIGLWSRIDGFRRQDLARAFARHDVVRATMMRGTLHVVRATDYARLRATIELASALDAKAALRHRAEGLDLPGLVAEATRCFEERPRTFAAIREALAARWPDADVRAMGHSVRLSLPLVQVPTSDPWSFPAAPEFALATRWLEHPLREAADPAWLFMKYLAAFGPATAGDLQTWSGLRGAGSAIDRLRPKLAVLRDERKRELLDLPNAPRPPEDTLAPARFLPEFDSVLLAHTDRGRIVADRHRKRVFLPGLRVAATFLVDGFVAGTWAVERKKDTATIAITPFDPLPKKVQDELAAEGELLARFIEADATSFKVLFVK